MSTGRVKTYIDFSAEREDWNVYELKDGTILKIRFLLSKAVREGIDERGCPNYSFASSMASAIFPPERLLGTPGKPVSAYSTEELESAVVARDFGFKARKEDFSSVYTLHEELGKLRLEIKPMLLSVAKTRLYDERGEPIYLTRMHAAIRCSPYPLPEEMRKRFLEIKKKSAT